MFLFKLFEAKYLYHNFSYIFDDTTINKLTYIYIVIFVFAYRSVMGRRKLRFYVTKNLEREINARRLQREGELKLENSITSFIVSLPIAAYNTSPAANLNILFKRLNVHSNLYNWALSTANESSGNVLALSLSKIHSNYPFVAGIYPDFIWTLTIGSSCVVPCDCNFLKDTPRVLNSVESVCALVLR